MPGAGIIRNADIIQRRVLYEEKRYSLAPKMMELWSFVLSCLWGLLKLMGSLKKAQIFDSWRLGIGLGLYEKSVLYWLGLVLIWKQRLRKTSMCLYFCFFYTKYEVCTTNHITSIICGCHYLLYKYLSITFVSFLFCQLSHGLLSKYRYIIYIVTGLGYRLLKE